MLSDITIGQYYRADSVVHRLDAATKLLLTVFFMVIIFVCRNFYSLMLMALLLILSVLLCKVPVKMFLKSLKPIIPIIIFTCVINIFYSAGGTELYHFWRFSITDRGIYTCIFTAIRIFSLIISSSILTYTTVPTDLTYGIERLLSPLKLFKLDIHTFAMMMTLALRFIPTLIEEIERITNAQKARGADFESGNIIQRVKAMIPILIPLFVSAFSRAQDLAFAMICRCYNGGAGRTRLKQAKLHAADFISFGVFFACLGGIIALNIYFGRLI